MNLYILWYMGYYFLKHMNLLFCLSFWFNLRVSCPKHRIILFFIFPTKVLFIPKIRREKKTQTALSPLTVSWAPGRRLGAVQIFYCSRCRPSPKRTVFFVAFLQRFRFSLAVTTCLLRLSKENEVMMAFLRLANFQMYTASLWWFGVTAIYVVTHTQWCPEVYWTLLYSCFAVFLPLPLISSVCLAWFFFLMKIIKLVLFALDEAIRTETADAEPKASTMLWPI